MGMTEGEREFAKDFRRLIEAAAEQSELLRVTHADLKDRAQLGRYLLHRYVCNRNCHIASVFRYGGLTLCWVSDVKYSQGLNERVSVPAARIRNTLDGARHWPSAVFNLEELAEWPEAGMRLACRHVAEKFVSASEALRDVEGVVPGRQRRPTILVSRNR